MAVGRIETVLEMYSSTMILAKPIFVAPVTNDISSTQGTQGTQGTQSSSVKKMRCEHGYCRVKLSLTAFPCRCGKLFCPSHRHSEDHSCTYDFKEEESKRLGSQLVKISGNKLDKV